MLSDKEPQALIFSKPNTKECVEASVCGVLRGVLALPLEYPFDFVKTSWQASPATPSLLHVMRETYQNYGFKGFYCGISANIFGVIFKQSYRWPLMLALPPYFQQHVVQDTNYPALCKGLTGVTVASFESFIVTPFEKFQILLMTNPKYKTMRDVFKDHTNPIKNSMRDLNIVYATQVVGWSSFLIADYHLRKLAHNYHGNNEKLPLTTLMAISGAVGSINTALIMPFDTVKTLLQKHQPWPNHGVMPSMYQAYEHFGLKGLYTGWQMRMAQCMIQAFFTSTLLETLENKVRDVAPKFKY